MTLKKLLITASLVVAPACLLAQGHGLDPAKILKPLSDAWPTYNGDYSGKRYSVLTQINQLTVKNLTLAWTMRLTAGSMNGSGGDGFGGGRGGASTNFIIGGEGTGDYPAGGPPTIKASALMVDGTFYVTAPDNAWAIDARDGRELWHYFWKTRGGTHIANRGFGMWNDYLYMETPDNYLVSLDAKTGKERWHKVIADFNQQYFSTMAPIVIGNHVIVGTGNDLDTPGFLQSFDPETGELQWKLYTVPMNPGDPGLDTWPSLDAARHGGAQPWLPGVYDPETKLYIFGTGNPTPAYTLGPAAKATTCSPASLDRRQRRHRQDGLVLPDRRRTTCTTGTRRRRRSSSTRRSSGRMRKLVLTAARNGYFFMLDRVTGEHLVTSKYGIGDQLGRRASTRRAARAQPGQGSDDRRIARLADRRRHDQLGAAGVLAGHRPLLRLASDNGYSIFYLTDPDPRGSMGLGGKQEVQRRQRRQLPDRDRLQDRQGRVAAPVSDGRRRRWRRRAGDRRQARVRRRRRRQHRRARRSDRHAALALAHRRRHEPAADLPARRPSVPAGGAPATRCGRLSCTDWLSAAGCWLLAPGCWLIRDQACQQPAARRQQLSMHLHRARADAAAEVVELHVRMIGEQRHRHARCRRALWRSSAR